MGATLLPHPAGSVSPICSRDPDPPLCFAWWSSYCRHITCASFLTLSRRPSCLLHTAVWVPLHLVCHRAPSRAACGQRLSPRWSSVRPGDRLPLRHHPPDAYLISRRRQLPAPCPACPPHCNWLSPVLRGKPTFLSFRPSRVWCPRACSFLGPPGPPLSSAPGPVLLLRGHALMVFPSHERGRLVKAWVGTSPGSVFPPSPGTTPTRAHSGNHAGVCNGVEGRMVCVVPAVLFQHAFPMGRYLTPECGGPRVALGWTTPILCRGRLLRHHLGPAPLYCR